MPPDKQTQKQKEIVNDEEDRQQPEPKHEIITANYLKNALQKIIFEAINFVIIAKALLKNNPLAEISFHSPHGNASTVLSKGA